MNEYIYYIALGVIAIIAIQSFRGGHVMVAVAVLALGAWVIYNHDKQIDISDTIYQTIDEGAKSEYERKGIDTEAYDYDLSQADRGSSVKFNEDNTK